MDPPQAKILTFPSCNHLLITSFPQRQDMPPPAILRLPKVFSVPFTYPVPGDSRNWAILSRMAANSCRGIATSAIWNVTYWACRTTLAPILISFSRNVVRVHWLILLGRASVRRKFPRLYANAKSWSRTSLSRKSWHESRVQVSAILPSLIHCSAVPRLL
jgi:hypothetical protein